MARVRITRRVVIFQFCVRQGRGMQLEVEGRGDDRTVKVQVEASAREPVIDV